jgi:hypothetical protein
MAKKLRGPQGPTQVPTRNASLQGGWKWCAKCQGLWHRDTDPGFCPAGGGHTDQGSGQYDLVLGDPANPGQHSWRWCKKCEGLWFSGNHSLGICPAGPVHVHDGAGSGDYALAHVASAPGQHDWKWCIQCQGLWFAGNNSPGACPADGGHVFGGSADYALKMV